MIMSSEICVSCLSENIDENGIKSIELNDNDDVKIINKLQKCVPEVQWENDGKICDSCLNKLREVCAFRELCIRSDLQRSKKKLNIIKKEEKDVDDEKLKESDDLSEQYICYHCSATFKSKHSLAIHIKSKHEYNKTKNKKDTNETSELLISTICDICGATFTNKYLLKRHIRNVHATEKKYKCELCDSKFASPVYLSAHKRYHTGERKHICSFCGKGYITASDLYHHEKIHANKRAYRCEICPKAFNTSSDLHKHKICVHLDRAKWKYECTFCQRRFPLKTNLDTHTKTHTGERNFLCHLCDRKCINKSVLKRHIESHSMVKSFKCHVCSQAYKYKKSLNIHLVKMHGIGDAAKLPPERIKRYFCTMCPKSYFANNKLQKHIRSHTGERPFQCPACEKTFIDKSYVKHHLKTAHNVLDLMGEKSLHIN